MNGREAIKIETVRLYYGYIDGPRGFSTLHGYAIRHPTAA
jgi:hypothetical protein